MIAKDLDELLKLAFIEGFYTHKEKIKSQQISWEDVSKEIERLKKEYKTTVDDILKPTQDKILDLYDEVVQHYKEQNLTKMECPAIFPKDKEWRFYKAKVHHAIGEIDYLKINSPNIYSAIKLFYECYPEGNYDYIVEFKNP